MRTVLILLVMLLQVSLLHGQELPARAFTNVTLHHHNGDVTENATIVWRNGTIIETGKKANLPFDAYVIDGGDSLHIYPGFIDGLALWASPDAENNRDDVERPGEPPYDRAGIQPQRLARNFVDGSSDKKMEEGQKHGFTTFVMGLNGQMLPGQLDVMNNQTSVEDKQVFRKTIGLQVAFNAARGVYPSTLMGMMAKLRQLWYDADALQNQQNLHEKNPETYPYPGSDEVLESLYPYLNGEKPLYFAANTPEDIERVIKLKNELGFDLVLVSAEMGYLSADLLKKENISVLASVDLPEKPDWLKDEKKDEDEEDKKEEKKEEVVSDEVQEHRDKQLESYKEQLANIKKLNKAGVLTGIATNGQSLKDWKKAISTLNENDYTDKELLRLMTVETAKVLEMDHIIGKLKNNYMANFTVFDKPFLEEKAKAVYSISAGIVTEIEE